MSKFIHRFRTYQDFFDAMNGKEKMFLKVDTDEYTCKGISETTGRYMWDGPAPFETVEEIPDVENGFTLYFDNGSGEWETYAMEGGIFIIEYKRDKNTSSYIEPWVAFTEGKGIDYNKPLFVNLGLPSKILWATCNIGAENPEDYGGFYAWGETETKERYNWSTYKFGSSRDNLTKYNSTDGKMILDPEDDAAHVVMGGKWRMPTSDEAHELIDNTVQTWETLNGVNGMRFTGANNKSIFIPAAGRSGGSGEGEDATCYTSELLLYGGGPSTTNSMLMADSDGASVGIGGARCWGYPIRGVMKR